MDAENSSIRFSIGQVVKKLNSAYPDLTVSKVRYLEDEGLISPDRTPSGYRSFKQSDIDRLEAVLRMQKTYFYPLAVIREKLKEQDEEGKEIAELTTPAVLSSTATIESGKYPIEKIPELLGVNVGFVRELERFNLVTIDVTPKSTPIIHSDEFPLIQAAYELQKYGIEPRHLRIYFSAANRESTLFLQVLSGICGGKSSNQSEEDQERLETTYKALDEYTTIIKKSLLKNMLKKSLPLR